MNSNTPTKDEIIDELRNEITRLSELIQRNEELIKTNKELIKINKESIQTNEESIQTNEESIKQLLKQNNELLLKDILKKLMAVNEKNQIEDPYDTLTKWSRDAITQIKRDVSNSIQDNDKSKEKKAQKQADDVDKLLNKVVGLLEKIKQDDLLIKNDNPFYPPSKLLSWSWRKKQRSARNSISLLMAGIGLIVLSSGVWEASGDILSIQGRLIIGAIMIAMTAWLERRKVFALFGQE